MKANLKELGIKEAAVRAALDAAVGESLRYVAGGLGVLYLIFAASHITLMSWVSALPLTICALVSAVALLALSRALKFRPAPVTYAHPLGVGIAGIVLLNSALHIALMPEPQQTTNFMLLAVGVGCFFLSTRWLAIVLAKIIVVWLLIVWWSPAASGWSHFAFAMMTSVALSVIFHSVRVVLFRRMQILRLQDDRRKAELEDLLTTAEESKQTLSATNNILEAAAGALQRSEARFRRLAEATFEGVVVHIDGTVVDVNEAMGTIFDQPLPEMVGKNVLSFAAPQHHEAIKEDFEFNRGVPYEAVGVRTDGSTFPIEMCSKMLDYQGRITGITAIRDITERKRAAETLREKDIIAARLEQFTITANTLSHEVNNPLAIIMGNTQLLGRSKTLDEKERERVENIEAAARRLTSLVRQLGELRELKVIEQAGIQRLELESHDDLSASARR